MKELKLVACNYCDDEGQVETDNNGPIGICPICNGEKYYYQSGRDHRVKNQHDDLLEMLAKVYNAHRGGYTVTLTEPIAREIRDLIARCKT